MYEYLKQYCGYNPGQVLISPFNSFGSLYPNELQEAEEFLGMTFPSELREFYTTIGVGSLQKPHIVPDNYKFYNKNDILPPMVAARFAKGILSWENQDAELYYMSESTYESLSPGDLPMFEVGDGTYFMIMRPKSDNPNTVYTDNGIKIEDSFERFIWRLYYEDISFFDKIVDKYYLEVEGIDLNKLREEDLARSDARDERYRTEYEKLQEQIAHNKCPNCGHVKKTATARQCLNCMTFSDPQG